MNPVTHLSLSWLAGYGLENRRDRALVAWSGVIPDLDSLSLLGGRLAYANWHHVVTHGLFAAVATAAVCSALARRRLATAAFALVTFHLHLLCDLVGSGYDWTIVYWFPLARTEYRSPITWNLESWPNVVITLTALLAIGLVGVRRGRTFVEVFAPLRFDHAIVAALRVRFGGLMHK